MNLSFIKLDIDIMNDTKIKIIRKLPAGNDIIVSWIGILCLAMKSGKPGILEIGEGIPFNDELLSAELDIELSTMRLALETFERLKMIEYFENGEIYITNFEKRQKLDKIYEAKEKHRIAQSKYRDKQKMLLSCDNHVTKSDVTEKESDIDIEKEIDKKNNDQLFDEFWNLYDYKKGKPKSYKSFIKLSEKDKNECIKAIPEYIKSTPDKKFRKHPLTYINQRAWEDEIVNKPNNQQYDISTFEGRFNLLKSKNKLHMQENNLQRTWKTNYGNLYKPDWRIGKITTVEEYEQRAKQCGIILQGA